MFHKIFTKQCIIELHEHSPYLKERLIYLDYWQKHGASVLSLQRIAELLLIIVNCLNLDSSKTITVREIKTIFKTLVYPARHHKKGTILSLMTRNACAGHAIKWLRMINRLSSTKITYPFSKQLFCYENYQRNEKKLSENTIKAGSALLEKFLSYLLKKRFFLGNAVYKM